MEVTQLLVWTQSLQGFGEEKKASFSPKNLLRYSRTYFVHSVFGAIKPKVLNPNSKSSFNHPVFPQLMGSLPFWWRILTLTFLYA